MILRGEDHLVHDFLLTVEATETRRSRYRATSGTFGPFGFVGPFVRILLARLQGCHNLLGKDFFVDFDMGVEPKIGVYILYNPKIIHLFIGFFMFFHHPFWGKPPYFWKHTDFYPPHDSTMRNSESLFFGALTTKT